MNATRQRGRAILRRGRMTVRDFPAHVVADIVIAGAASETAKEGALVLIAYLSGSNMSRCPVALRGPVELVGVDERVLTGSARQPDTAVEGIVRFRLAGGASAGRSPQPFDPRLTLRTVGATRSASIWFVGEPTPARVAELTARLQTFVALRCLTPATFGDRATIRASKRGPFEAITELSMQLSEWPASSQMGLDRTLRRTNGRTSLAAPSGRDDGKAHQFRQ